MGSLACPIKKQQVDCEVGIRMKCYKRRFDLIINLQMFLLMLLLSASLLLVWAVWRHVCISGQDSFHVARMEMPLSGEFKVLQIADVQIGHLNDACKDLTKEEDQWPCDGRNTTAFIERLTRNEKPDLVVFTGDNVYGTKGEKYAQKLLALMTMPMRELKIPFVMVLGNHDVELPFMSATKMHVFLRKDSSAGGAGALMSGNGVIKVMRNHTELIQIHLFEYMYRYCIRCTNGVQSPNGGYLAVTEKQIRRFEEQSNPRVPSLAFAHIPLAEYKGMPMVGGGDNFDSLNFAADGKLYDALYRQNVSVFSAGHDHNNDFCGRRSGGVYLCYGGGVGYTTYGKAGWARRARIFVVQNGTVRTYIRRDDANFSKTRDRYANEVFYFKWNASSGVMDQVLNSLGQ